MWTDRLFLMLKDTVQITNGSLSIHKTSIIDLFSTIPRMDNAKMASCMRSSTVKNLVIDEDDGIYSIDALIVLFHKAGIFTDLNWVSLRRQLDVYARRPLEVHSSNEVEPVEDDAQFSTSSRKSKSESSLIGTSCDTQSAQEESQHSSSSPRVSECLQVVPVVPHNNLALNNLPREHLIEVVNRQDNKIKTMEAQMNSMEQKLKRAQSALKEQTKEARKKSRSTRRSDSSQLSLNSSSIVEAGSSSSTDFAIVFKGKTEQQVSERSQLSIAIRRNFANTSAKTFGTGLMLDVSGQSVIRYEIKTWAAVIASARIFNTLAKEACLAGNGYELGMIVLRSDATNSSIWHQRKLSVLQVEVSYVPNWECLVDKLDKSEIPTRKTLSDIQVIHNCF